MKRRKEKNSHKGSQNPKIRGRKIPVNFPRQKKQKGSQTTPKQSRRKPINIQRPMNQMRQFRKASPNIKAAQKKSKNENKKS